MCECREDFGSGNIWESQDRSTLTNRRECRYQDPRKGQDSRSIRRGAHHKGDPDTQASQTSQCHSALRDY